MKHTEKEIRVITYYQVERLLEEGDCSTKYPIINDLYIKWGESESYSDNIWNQQIWLYNGDTYIDCLVPFSYCNTYAELAKGEVDCIEMTTNAIVDKIYEKEV